MDNILNTINKKYKERRKFTFDSFLRNVPPEHIFNNIFNVTANMVEDLVGKGVQEYPNDPESIDYVDYDLSEIFEKDQVDPFFSDRLFANRFVNKFKYIDKSSSQNRIYIFRGPPGSGKSTFLNCLVSKIQDYVNNGNGRMYEVIWKLDNTLSIPCPSHDNPILLLPKENRKELVEHLLRDRPELKEEVLHNKKYEWVFTSEPCTFCSSLVQALSDKGCDIFDHLFIRQYRLNKSVSEGISIFNANDELPKFKAQPTQKIQDKLDEFFEDQGSNVKYDHSIYAKSNNGIYALMDLNDKNYYRFKDLRGVVSEGKHKVNIIEEQVNSLFLIVTNPTDEEEVTDEALNDRKNITLMNYILVPDTVNKVFKKIYGENIDTYFHPLVMDCFSRVLISSRMKVGTNTIKHDWVKNSDAYNGICDDDLLILRMEVYGGNIPEWLKDDDISRFTFDIRKKIIDNADEDGTLGISDRKAIEIFGNLLQYYQNEQEYISIQKMKRFCERIEDDIVSSVPRGFIDAIEKFYMFQVTQQIKECIFQKNIEKIKNDIKNYLYTLNYNTGDTVTVPMTGDTIEITDEYYKSIEKPIFGASNVLIRDKVFKKYISEIGSDIEKTEQFKKLYESYLYGLKENVIDDFIGNETFRNAILDYGSASFESSYDNKIKRNVKNLINNMISKYGYSVKSAKEVVTYIFDKI